MAVKKLSIRTYISGMDRGRRNATLEDLKALANALNVTLSGLLEGL